MRISLNGTDWKLSGWARHQWYFAITKEPGGFSIPQVLPIPATVPGAVQADLLRAGLLKDWNMDLNFRDQEWVEHREWLYEKTFAAPEALPDRRFFLLFEGLDFAGHIFVNDQPVGDFSSMHIPIRVDVTEALRPGTENTLQVVFLQPPEVDGQVGYTSRAMALKSRYNYGWDWMPRLVNIGIFRDVWLCVEDGARLNTVYPRTVLHNAEGQIEVTADITAHRAMSGRLRCTVSGEGMSAVTREQSLTLKPGDSTVRIGVSVPSPRLWGNGTGEKQPLYTVITTLLDASGTVVDEQQHSVGFRTLQYERPEGAFPESLPYALRLNGNRLPIRGVNWVPLSPFYGTVTEADYRYILGQFRHMNVNLLRVWGGALLESETFYRICDEMGFLVWQEFPQSSSAIDNTPCEDPAFVKELVQVAEAYVIGRRHHACLAIWCAGNELYLPDYTPVNFTVGNIRALAEVVSRLDGERLFLPGSPSGPAADWRPDRQKVGDEHGPWSYGGVTEHYRRFNEDTSLLHSEVGAGACPREETLRRWCSGQLWPPTKYNTHWLGRGGCWLCDEWMESLFGPFDGTARAMTEYVKALRFTQLEALRYAATAIRRAGAAKAGLIVWMGNEPFPNNNNNASVLEYDGCPKPGFYALQRAFAPTVLALAYDSVLVREGKISVRLFGCSDRPTSVQQARVAAYDPDGRLLGDKVYRSVVLQNTTFLGTVELPAAENITLVRVTGVTEEGTLCEDYVFTACEEAPYGALLEQPSTRLTLTRLAEDCFSLTNEGRVIAFYVDIIGKNQAEQPLVISPGYRCLLPGECVEFTTSEPCAQLSIAGFNTNEIRWESR